MHGLRGTARVAALGVVNLYFLVGYAPAQAAVQGASNTDLAATIRHGKDGHKVLAMATPANPHPPAAPDFPLGGFVPATPEIRVMTFNVRVKIFLDMLTNSWDSRKALLIKTVRDFDPDILGTQECLAEQSDYLKEQLPEYGFVGVGRNDGQLRGEMVGIFYKIARFELMGTGNFWLSKRPNDPGSRGWDALFPRMVTWAKLRPLDGSQPFCVFNTHFDVLGPRARLESAKLLRAQMQSIAPNMPTIITGDFNADGTPDSAPYRTLLARAPGVNLTDVFRQLHPTHANDEGTLHNFSGTERGRRIDWIVATPNFVPVSATILHTNNKGKYPSDHFPVGAVFRVLPAATVAVIE